MHGSLRTEEPEDAPWIDEATPWAEADRQLRDAAQVTGGLSPEQRRELYEQHAAAVIASARPGHDEQGGADQ